MFPLFLTCDMLSILCYRHPDFFLQYLFMDMKYHKVFYKRFLNIISISVCYLSIRKYNFSYHFKCVTMQKEMEADTNEIKS
ncbi:hypothetical protein DW716_18910 [Absiella sp. AM27-20]|nr:hypothetical protein DW716_18910 [Absiella sp. AM27-20]